MSSDDQAFTRPETIPERNWPCLRQFCVFIENRVGSLHDLMRHLERHDLRVVALSIDNSVDFAVVRLMVDSYERARELFHLGGYSFIENDIIGVELPDELIEEFLFVDVLSLDHAFVGFDEFTGHVVAHLDPPVCLLEQSSVGGIGFDIGRPVFDGCFMVRSR